LDRFVCNCFISRHSWQNFIEIHSLFVFSKGSFTHATAWNPQMCQQKHVPWLFYDIYTGLIQCQTNFITQTCVFFDHPNFIGVINLDTSHRSHDDGSKSGDTVKMVATRSKWWRPHGELQISFTRFCFF